MKRNEIILLCCVFLIAFGLRCYNFSYPAFQWMDEKCHVAAATNYWENGQFEPDNWEHPALRHITLYGFLQIFGDNPAGWRMRNILFGAIVAVLTFLFARETGGSRKIAVMAGLLLATDPLHVVLSRYTFEEVYGGAFFLGAIVLYLMHNRRSGWLMMSAFFMGCALATKWYYVPCWFLLALLALHEHHNYRDVRTILFIASVYLFIPLSVYLASYYLWFGRGYSLGEFLEFVQNAYYSLQEYRPQGYDPNLFFLTHTSAKEWFIRPVIVGQGTYLEGNRGEFIIYMNNLPIWILAIPSMIGLSILAVREKCLTIALPVLLFSATYGLYLFVSRPAFLYSATPLLPFAFTAIACALSRVTSRYGDRSFYLILAVMITWNIYLYPLVTAKKIPIIPYRYILNNADIKLHE